MPLLYPKFLKSWCPLNCQVLFYLSVIKRYTSIEWKRHSSYNSKLIQKGLFWLTANHKNVFENRENLFCTKVKSSVDEIMTCGVGRRKLLTLTMYKTDKSEFWWCLLQRTMWREIKKFFLSYNSKNFVCKQSRRTNLKLLKYARTLFSISEDVHTHVYWFFNSWPRFC